MEDLDNTGELDDGELISVGVVVVVQVAGGEQSVVRTYTSDTSWYRQIGLFEAATSVVRDGTRFPLIGNDDDDEEPDE